MKITNEFDIICHPVNLDLLKSKLNAGDFDPVGSKPGFSAPTFNVITNDHMEPNKKTGKYVLPNGKIVEEKDIRIRERFIEYGPEDKEWLLFSGRIHEDLEPLFYVIKKSDLRFYWDFDPIRMPQRHIIFATAF